jgi:hypothetical protein
LIETGSQKWRNRPAARGISRGPIVARAASVFKALNKKCGFMRA